MQKPIFNLSIVLLVSVLLFGCASAERGRKFDAAAANQFEVGKTTETEVLAVLGQPLARRINADGTKIYGYAYAQADGFALARGSKNIKGQGDKLIIKFDKNGVVSALDQGTMPVRVGSGLLKDQ